MTLIWCPACERPTHAHEWVTVLPPKPVIVPREDADEQSIVGWVAIRKHSTCKTIITVPTNGPERRILSATI